MTSKVSKKDTSTFLKVMQENFSVAEKETILYITEMERAWRIGFIEGTFIEEFI